jgi:hypothetical protein
MSNPEGPIVGPKDRPGSGIDDPTDPSAIAQLGARVDALEGAPSGASAPPFAEAEIKLPGFLAYPPKVTVALNANQITSPQTTQFTLTGGPYTIAAGGVVYPRINSLYLPDGSALDIGGGGWSMLVSNAAGTQKISVECNSINGVVVTQDVILDSGSVDQQVGSDLSINGSGRVVSAAGGEFFVTLQGRFDYTPPA